MTRPRAIAPHGADRPELIRASVALSVGIPRLKPVLPKGAVYEAATAIITATHGPRPKIGVVPHHSFYADYQVVVTDRKVAQFTAALDSAAAASAWDRRVSALTRAIAAETRVLL